MSGHRIRIPAESRIRIGGIEHRLHATTAVGWVFEVIGQPGVTRAITVDELEHEALQPDFRLDPHGGRPGLAAARSQAKADDLNAIPKHERAGVNLRLRFVRRYLALEQANQVSRSDASMDEAASRITKEFERERVEANERLKASSAASGRRERHDARPVSGVREETIKPVCGRTLRRWVMRYELGGRAALALRHRYHQSGNVVRRIEPEVQALLVDAAQGYASIQRPTRVVVHRDVRTKVYLLNKRRGEAGQPLVRCPSIAALSEEIARLGKFEVHAARHGEVAAIRKYAALSGGVDVTRAGERIEIDEWAVHCVTLMKRAGMWEILDAAWRKAAEKHRLVVCVALDVASRAVLAASFSTRENTAENAIACLAMIVTEKNSLAEWAGATSGWSMACTPEAVVTDGGAGFTSDEYETAVNDLVGDSDTTVAEQPQLRAHVERFFRTADTDLAPMVPGRTFANVVERGDYDSAARAAILDVLFKKLFYLWVCDVYHQRPHKGIKGSTPAAKWESLSGDCAPILTRGSELRRNALGVELSRVLGRHGVRVFGLDFTSDDIQLHFRSKGSVPVLVRVDPADLGRVSVMMPEGWVACPCVQHDMEGTSVAVWMAAEADLHRQYGAAAKLSEATVLEAILRIRAMVADAEVQFGLGGARPSPQELERLDRQIRITFPPRHGLGRKEPAQRDLKAVAIPRGTPVEAYAITGPDPEDEGRTGEELRFAILDGGAAVEDASPVADEVPASGPSTATEPTPKANETAPRPADTQPANTQEDDDGDDDSGYGIEDREADDGR